MAITINAAISTVKWDKFGEHMLRIYTGIYENLQYTDCELILTDGQLRASRMVLGMASPFLENIFAATNNQPVTATDPLIVLIPDVTVSCMRHILQFIYTGEVKLRPCDMSCFLVACYLLQIRGLKSNEGRVLGASISDSNPSTYDPMQQIETTYTCAPSTYLMSVVHPEPDQSNVVSETGRANGLETSIEQIVLHSTIVGEVRQESFPTTDSCAAVEKSDPQYYDAIEEERIDDNMPQPDDDEGTCDRQINPFDESVSMSCMDTLMADQFEEIKYHKVDTSTAEKVPTKEQGTTSYPERLEKAIDAIVNGGTSLRMASLAYNIPKTVLWRKTMKIPRPAKAQQLDLPSPRREAIEAIKAGEKLLNVSRRFDIPISTLYRDKLRLYSEGVLPDSVALKQRDKGDNFKQRVIEAAQQCVAGTMSLSEAARVYNLPKTTIWRKIRSIKEPGNKAGCTSGTLNRSRTKNRVKLENRGNSTAE